MTSTPPSALHSSGFQHPLAAYKLMVNFPASKTHPMDNTELFEVLRQYEIKGNISRGTFGFVVMAYDTAFEMPDPPLDEGPNAPPGTVAIKKVRGLFNDPRAWLSAVRELSMQRFFNHPNVIRAKDIMIPLGEHNNLSAKAIEMRQAMFDEVYIVMDYMDNTLEGLMESQEPFDGKNPLLTLTGDASSRFSVNPTWTRLRPLPAAARAYLLFQILHGLKYLHGCGVIHRDLKPANVLVDWQWVAKICDFGQGRGGLGNDLLATMGGQGTQWYLSPEQLRCDNNMGTSEDFAVSMRQTDFHAADVWAVGCIATEMILGKPIFDCSSGGGAFQLECIMNVLGKPSTDDQAALLSQNSSLRDELSRSHVQHSDSRLDRVLRAGIEGRPPPNEEEGEEAEAVDANELALIASMLCYDPSKRITITEALASPLFADYAEMTPTEQPAPFPAVDKAELEDAQAARRMIWKMFVECHPSVNELIEVIKTGPDAPAA